MKITLALFAGLVVGYFVGVAVEHSRTFDVRGFLRQEVADELFNNAFADTPDWRVLALFPLSSNVL